MGVHKDGGINQGEFMRAIFGVDDTSYLTHNYHPWAAKFIPQVPRYFIEKFTRKGDTIYDPFCGSGTTLVEALLLGRNAFGNDINHIASLVSKAKTTPLTPAQMDLVRAWRAEIATLQRAWPAQEVAGEIEDLTGKVDFNNKFHWFDKDVLIALMQIKDRIDRIPDTAARTFLLAAFSSIVVRVSRQESETRYAAIDKGVDVDGVFDALLKKADDMMERMQSFAAVVDPSNWVNVTRADSRDVTGIPDGSIKLVITSPPYANTYDYYLYHKLRMYLLGHDVRGVRVNEIGSRNRYSSQKQDITTFLSDMVSCFGVFRRVLEPDGQVVLVIGDSVIARTHYSGLNLISTVSREAGFDIIQAFSYKLDDISKLFNKRFRQKDKDEWVIILRKP